MLASKARQVRKRPKHMAGLAYDRTKSRTLGYETRTLGHKRKKRSGGNSPVKLATGVDNLRWGADFAACH